ncbi:MAG: DegT/DnrJ/EryC1/StrS family aminotransferase [Chloroflexota bacterium]
MMRIPIYQPELLGNEKKYVNDCLDTTWISSRGKYVPLFQERFAEYTGVKYAVPVCNGTVAIHLALLALGIGPGDEVIVPTLTYIASVNPIVVVGATPVFVDSCRDSWQIDPEDIRRKITPRTRAIMVVHLYGHPANMNEIMSISKEHNLFVVEDCAEAFASHYQDKHVGTFGDVGTFSFYGNKTITTGEGGMVITNDGTLHDRIRRLRGQGLAKYRTYWHDIIGFNYRMTNICAAIGLAQLEQADHIVERKLVLAQKYDVLLADLPVETHQPANEDVYHSYWMYSILVEDSKRDDMIQDLAEVGIETRPVFYPVHTMPMYATRYERHKVAESIGRRGINLPSWPGLSQEQIEYIVSNLESIIASYH